ncbi:50S ribosomal protein L11 methyltransferase [Sulfurospirillum sp. 1307]|jgi:ribosomal protein L11 methyltransferase
MKETYNELLITPSGEYEKFADFILSLGQSAIEEKDGDIIVRSEDDLSDVKFGVELFANSLSQALKQDITVKTSLHVKENIDWIQAYKDSIKSIEVGKFFIYPSWENPKDNKINIIIDPALAFGSGHHETTYGCLEMIGKYVKKDDSILDVGCGSGILSIASAKLGGVVDLCDTDELATKSAIENFKLNNVKFNDIWTGSVKKGEKKYDVVVANIIADVLIMLANDLVHVVKDNGTLILSGILDKYIDRVESRYNKLEILEKYKKYEWYTLVLKKVVNESK